MAREKFERSSRAGGECWFDTKDVELVEAIPTKYGDRLLVTFRDSGRTLWLDDNPDARRHLDVA